VAEYDGQLTTGRLGGTASPIRHPQRHGKSSTLGLGSSLRLIQLAGSHHCYRFFFSGRLGSPDSQGLLQSLEELAKLTCVSGAVAETASTLADRFSASRRVRVLLRVDLLAVVPIEAGLHPSAPVWSVLPSLDVAPESLTDDVFDLLTVRFGGTINRFSECVECS